jgi:hypothetical protein
MVTTKSSNVKEWKAAFTKYAKVKRNMTHREIINHYGGQACLWAVKFTPKARKSKALSDKNKPKKPSPTPTRSPAKRRRRIKRKEDVNLFHRLATGYRRTPGGWVKHRGVHKGEGNYNEALRIYNSKRRSIGAVKAGFLKPAAMLGQKVRNRSVKLYSSDSAAKSWGKKSSLKQLKAEAFNNVAGSGVVSERPMSRGMSEVIRREMEYVHRKMQATDNKFSAKKFR